MYIFGKNAVLMLAACGGVAILGPIYLLTVALLGMRTTGGLVVLLALGIGLAWEWRKR